MTLDKSKPMWMCRGILVVHNENGPIGIDEKSFPELWAEAQEHLAEYPDALVPEPSPAEPTEAQKAESIRQQRNALLLQTDYTQLNDAPKDKIKYSTYRQLLRDIPQQKDFPNKVKWPEEPK